MWSSAALPFGGWVFVGGLARAEFTPYPARIIPEQTTKAADTIWVLIAVLSSGT